MQILLRVLAAMLILFVSTSSLGATYRVDTNVTGVLLEDDVYGGCMAKLAVSPSSETANCGANWVVFDCDGTRDDTSGKSLAAQKLSAAQLAYVTRGLVRVVFDDQRKINGFCYAQRIENR